ncbi:AAHS family 4-hydroxybenzoate transporter-like MFS transporter [Paucibacter oligotrophus]|uniref:AAHS family 4-hydroxybenzoate transporter-like MFS transporter n=1 Tax=Roseateles oligotrophus TaxID=1769250 RepID=A0A840LLE4_9BURK|nr:aromatic acid/H+ symport family MFS transporter [Roseateles oligotrophus]MBB4846127.1 AAHS family 4-hydroxybenzoate transporter-like MFS transporter [Roseateles oligotrophus]
MAFATQAVDIPQLIDDNRIGRFQLLIFVLVGLTVVMDGFDVQAMGFVAPAIIKEWGVSKAELGPVFGAGLFGMLLGSLSLSVLADRIGRRPVLIGASVFFAACMLATTWASSIVQLELIRFITGLGLGAIMPNAMALVGEYSPRRKRVTLMMLVSCGFTVGAVLGGLLSAALIPAYGWRSVFYIGTALPLLMALLMWRYVPESLQFMVLKQRRLDRVAGLLRRIDPGFVADAGTRYQVAGPAARGAPVGELFRQGRATVTLLLWLLNFMNLLNLYFLSNWLPTIAASAGLSTQTAVLVGTVLQLGGVLGTVLMGPVIDRIGFYRMLLPSFALAVFSIAMIGQPGLSLPLLFLVVMVTGFCIVGGQPAINALAATYYPTTLRSTGIGWSLGVGRIGSIIGPVLGGELIRRNWSHSQLFLAVAVPAAISTLVLLCMAWLARQEQGRGGEAAPLQGGGPAPAGGLE